MKTKTKLMTNDAYDVAIAETMKLLHKLVEARERKGKHYGDAGDAQHVTKKFIELLEP